MLAQLWSGGYILDWSGLVCEFSGAALAAFGIVPRNIYDTAMKDDFAQTSALVLMLQAKQVRFGLVVLAIGSLLQCAGTFVAALPHFA